MLTLKLGDASNTLLGIGTSKGAEISESGQILIGAPDYDEDGNLRFRKLEVKNRNESETIGIDCNKEILALLQKDYEDIAPEYMQKSPEITNLVLSNISTGLIRAEHSKDFWMERLETGQQDYKKWMENLANTLGASQGVCTFRFA